MSASNSLPVCLTFRLDVEDDWPPVAAEGLQCLRTEAGFHVMSTPLFVKNLSVGDVIAVTDEEQNQVWSWEHISKSTNSTVWLLRLHAVELQPIFASLSTIGCNVTSLVECGVYALDVPRSVSAAQLDECLGQLDATKVAVAYPSWRHEETM
jgi:hypothetical protein